MFLAKVRIIRYCIGRRSVRKGTPGAKRRVEQSRKWYAFWWQGKQKRKMPLSANRREAEQRMKELERNLWRLKVGLADEFAEHRQRPIGEHVADFVADLNGKSRSVKHVKTMKRMLEQICRECVIGTLDDLTTGKIDTFLLALASEGKSARTRNSYRQAIVGFSEWCAVKGRIAVNPLKNVSKAEGRQVRQRRALTVDELKRLLAATEKRNPERALLYRIALYTGLRKGEIATLRVRHLCLDDATPTIRLEGQFTKNKQEAVLPLLPFLADLLRERCRDLPKDAKVIGVSPKINVRIRKDLAAAGIPFRDDSGRYADFHALRKCCATLLTMQGVHPRIIQQILRHSTVDLTMTTYTDATLLPLQEAMAKMPVL